jgi:hypothetical protein
MSQIYDPLEAELRDLAPHKVSPALKQRIGKRLADSVSARSQPWGIALAGALAAACLAALLLGWRSSTDIQANTASHPAEMFVEFDDKKPTLLAYRHALSRSPKELEALLDKHADLMLPPDARGMRVQAFAQSEADLLTWIGEL